MSDLTNAAPAGASEHATAPEHIGPMDTTAAAARFAELDNEPEEAAAAAPGSDDQSTIDNASPEAPEADAEAATEDAGEEASDDDAETPPAEDADDTDAKTEEDQLAHGNMRTRLRDGTVTTVGELKKLADEAKELRAKAPQLATQERQLQEREAQLAQQTQFVQQVLPQAVALMQAYIPPEPDPALLQTDPIGHYEQKIRRDQALAQLQQMQGAYEAQSLQQQKQSEQARAAELRSEIERNKTLLVERIPEIAQPEKAKEIYQGFVDLAAKYGFKPEEVANVYDARLFHMIYAESKKAAAYDRLMAQKPAVEAKTKAAPPVAQPGRRVSAEAGNRRATDDMLKRAKQNGGNINDAAAIFATLE